jgi:uncharacterized protein (TIGR02302 family)
VTQDPSGWRNSVRFRLAEWRKTRPRRLTLLAQGALALERLVRALAPAAIVIGFFVALSWTGIWLGAPTFLRVLGVAAFIGALVAALTRLRDFSWPSAGQARDALDAGDSDAPAAALADALANSGDPQTQGLWRLHQRRAEQLAAQLQPVVPSPKLWTIDRHALGALAVLALVATGLLAGPEKYARVAAAFDWRWRAADGAPSRLDAWIDPPGYTGKPPIVLSLQNAGEAPGPISAPIGSTIVVRAANATDLRVSTQGEIEAAPAASGPDSTAKERRFALRGDGSLTIGRGANEVGRFTLRAIHDLPPRITALGPPQTNLRGSFALSYRIEDDYGARDAQVAAKPAAGETARNARALVPPPSGSLDLPAGPGGLGEGRTTLDWSDSPYSGARVDLALSVHDEGGGEGQAVLRNFVLPGKVFKNPFALALIEQRRILALDAAQRDRVLAAIDALMIAPDIFTPDSSAYLGLRFVHDSLRHARNDAELVAVVDFLWEMALRIEDGDSSQAERDLRAAEQALREALKRGASPEEIAKLTEQMKKALDQYLNAMQDKAAKDKAAKNDKGSESETGEGQSITPKDLKSMLDQLAEAAKDGDKDAAMELLDRMRDMLDNLKTAEQSERSNQAAQNRRNMRDIDNLMREQQKLRDDTFSQDRDSAKGADQQPGDEEAQDGQGESPQERAAQSPGAGKGKRQGQRGGAPREQGGPAEQGTQGELGQRQGELEKKLNSLKKRAESGAGKKSEGLAEAEDGMKQAEQALKQGDNESALSAQGRALEGLRKGAAEIAQQGGENGPSDDQEQAGEKNGQGLKGQNGEGRFGRANKQNNIDATAAQKARKVLEELRRRLSDPSRAREELDYLERLIKPD